MIDSGSSHSFPVLQPPVPFGAHPSPDGVQFYLFSRHASHVWLMLFDDADDAEPTREFELDPFANRMGDVWHIHVPGARAGQFYLYRMTGPRGSPDGRWFDAGQWLLDPYARAVSGSPTWGESPHLAPGERPRNGPGFPKGVILDDDFDWSEDVTPQVPLQDTILYEVHARGYTAHPSAGVQSPGTYRGLIEKIPHLQDLGVTSVELLPIHEFNEMEFYIENRARRELRNLWGYNTVAFFAPNQRYAHDNQGGNQVREFKQLVLAMHRAGLEVILDVVFNHTAELDRTGPTYSFRGIANNTFYLMEKDGRTYRNFSGCGNTVNANQPMVRQFILECLRYWVREMHVDGFRFDLATILCRGAHGEILHEPPLIAEISEDPVLRHAKLIAEAWDAGGGYQVGSFPGRRWAEWNGKYRDDVRRFWRGDPGMLGTFAGRISGSADLYDHHGQSPLKSVNYVTCHDGFTLRDLVSYVHKHNEANAENNRDGEKLNHSVNLGVEGPTDDPEIQRLRLRQMKNLAATLLLSQGIPMLLGGDEFGNSQQGNNNAYCQDNEIGWVDWDGLSAYAELHQFIRRAIALRRRHPGLRRVQFFHGDRGDGNPPDIVWFGPNGEAPDWDGGDSLGCLLSGAREHTGARHTDDTLALLFNAATVPVQFRIPSSEGRAWRIVLSTETKRPHWETSQETILVDGRAVLVLASARDGGGS